MRVLVTGATRGIGKAVCQKFKENNYTVLGVGTTQCKLDYVDEYLQCDFSDYVQLENFCSIIKDVDILINNAGINIIDKFCDINPQDFSKVQQINLYAPFRISQTVIPYMIKNGWGRIVNLSSVWGKISKEGRASYSASKFAIDGMTVAMANEFASQGILCNSVSPGFIDTEMTWKNLKVSGVEKILQSVPIGRLAKVEEVARLIYFLGTNENTYISGQNISIDGGFTRA